MVWIWSIIASNFPNHSRLNGMHLPSIYHIPIAPYNNHYHNIIKLSIWFCPETEECMSAFAVRSLFALLFAICYWAAVWRHHYNQSLVTFGCMSLLQPNIIIHHFSVYYAWMYRNGIAGRHNTIEIWCRTTVAININELHRIHLKCVQHHQSNSICLAPNSTLVIFFLGRYSSQFYWKYTHCLLDTALG